MRKQIVGHQSRKPSPADTSWLHLEELAQIEITSEDSAHPVESALTPGNGSGWRATEPGEQMLRLLFDKPLSLRHLRLMFREEEAERTQEFLLRWSSDGGTSYGRSYASNTTSVRREEPTRSRITSSSSMESLRSS